MDTEHLVTMVNEIAAFFATASEGETAPQEVAAHLQRYWEPRMRAELLAHLVQGGTGLTPLARAAVQRLPAPDLAALRAAPARP
jgi:formate dehydrogenase subunit delta